MSECPTRHDLGRERSVDETLLLLTKSLDGTMGMRSEKWYEGMIVQSLWSRIIVGNDAPVQASNRSAQVWTLGYALMTMHSVEFELAPPLPPPHARVLPSTSRSPSR